MTVRDREAVLGVDIGTGSLKTALFGLDGSLVALRRVAFSVSSPEPGASEQDPGQWWSAFATACRDILETLESDTHIMSVAIGGQAPTLAPVDADLQPTHPAITWLDSRTSMDASRLYARLGQPVPVWGSWPAQASWFVHNRPDRLRQTRWLLGCPDYVVSRLIGSPLALLEVTSAELDAGDLDGAVFPAVWTPGRVVGGVTRSASMETRLPEGTPVVGGFIDGLLGVLGSGVRKPGEACINCGTSGTYTVIAEPPLGWPVLGANVVGSASNSSGLALDWFATNVLDSACQYPELLESAASVAPGSDGLLFLPQLAGERGATSDAYARGAWIGLTLGHDRRHLLRSLLEGVAFSFRAMQDWVEACGAPVRDVRCVGGQAHSDVWNRIKADVLNRRLDVPEVVEAVALGAAILAAVGVGVYPDLDTAAESMVRINRSFVPDPSRVAVYAQLFDTYQSLYPALRETNWALRDIPTGPAT